MRQCCFVRTSKDVVGGSVYNTEVRIRWLYPDEETNPGSIITRGIGLYPHDIFAPSKTPLRKDLSTSFQAVPSSAPYPKENEGGIGR